MAETPAPRLIDHVILPHPSEPRVLLLPGVEGWTLPHWTAPSHFWHVVEHVNQAMQGRFGVQTTILRWVGGGHDPVTQETHNVYASENHTPDWKPPGGARWVGQEALPELNLAIPEHLPLFQDWFIEAAAGHVPKRRVPWARPGWFDEAAAWVRAELDRAGLSMTGPVEQMRTWQRSCILRAGTAAGDVYLKAVPGMFALEPLLTKALATRHPAHLPRVLAVDPGRHWLLMQELGGKPLDEFPDIQQWEEAVRQFARLQIDSAGRMDELLALGCPDRRLHHLAAAIPPLVEDASVLLRGGDPGLSEAEVRDLQALAPRLASICAELASYRVPHSLEHGDFHYGQVIVTGEGCVYIDWSDSSVAHPFFSMFPFFAYAEMLQGLPSVPDASARLRHAYLEPWTIYEPMDRLIAAFDLSQALAALHIAVTYQRFILPNLETRAEWEAAAPWFLRRLLRSS